MPIPLIITDHLDSIGPDHPSRLGRCLRTPYQQDNLLVLLRTHSPANHIVCRDRSQAGQAVTSRPPGNPHDGRDVGYGYTFSPLPFLSSCSLKSPPILVLSSTHLILPVEALPPHTPHLPVLATYTTFCPYIGFSCLGYSYNTNIYVSSLALNRISSLVLVVLYQGLGLG